MSDFTFKQIDKNEYETFFEGESLNIFFKIPDGCKIQEIVKNKAHSMGIRFSRVNARNTSALAFDGSGYVTRNTKGDIATFTTGKIYFSCLR